MFFPGSIQEGISNAVEKQKLVLCFVTGMPSLIVSVWLG